MPPEWGVQEPQFIFCSTDLDCGGCLRCREGMCDRSQWAGTTCMCHDECVAVGQKSCDVSRRKPLCGGTCSDAPPTVPLACGQGQDVVRTEPYRDQGCLVGAAVASRGRTVAIETKRAALQPATAATCTAPCACLEAIGPESELFLPSGDRVDQSAVTFANGYWYVAWGANEARTTFVQRFTADGAIEGQALRIEGTLPNGLTSTAHDPRHVILSGWVSPAYTPAGSMMSIHRLTPTLASSSIPLLLRAPHGLALGRSMEADATGALVWTDLLDRPGGLAREARLSPGLGTNQVVASRTWRVGSDRDGRVVRVDGRPYVVDVAEGAVRVRRLLDDGRMGAVQRVIEVPPTEGRQILLSEQVGNRFYVGARGLSKEQPVRVQALDSQSMAPVGRLIDMRWPGPGPYFLADANGTALVVGALPGGGPAQVSVVALDPASGTACPVNALVLPSLPGYYVMIRAIHFEGDVGGMTVSAHSSSGAGRAFFTRVRCLARCPAFRG